jgi:multidrug efflux pump
VLGTIAGTVLGLFFIPLFYVVIKRIFKSRPQAEGAAPAAAPQEVK